MTVIDTAANALLEIEEDLLHPTKGGIDSVNLAERIRVVRRLLQGTDVRWIGTTEAKRLLAIGSENTVKAWARMGMLRSRHLPNGRLQVRLDDVLRRREEREGLSGFDNDEELTAEELRVMREARPGRNPWERTKPDSAP